MKRAIHMGATCAFGCMVVACGGGGAGTNQDQPGANVTTYEPGTPVVGATDAFTITSVDDSNNTTVVGYTQQVQSVSGPHSYVLTLEDPSNNSVIVNGIDYHLNATTINFDQAHETSLSDTSSAGTVQNCSLTTQSGGHPLPWWVGQSYSVATQESCTPGDIRSITASGEVSAVEQVTVPAGTFNALRLQSTEVWIENGQTVTEQITHWVDPAHWLFTIKTVTTYARSGNVPAHYVTSQTVQLQSRTGG